MGKREEKEKMAIFPTLCFCLFVLFFNKKEKPRDKQKNKHKTASFPLLTIK